MNCEQLAENLTDFMEGELSDEEEAEALEHLSTCSSCETVLANTEGAIGLLAEHGSAGISEKQSSELLQKIMGHFSDN